MAGNQPSSCQCAHTDDPRLCSLALIHEPDMKCAERTKMVAAPPSHDGQRVTARVAGGPAFDRVGNRATSAAWRSVATNWAAPFRYVAFQACPIRPIASIRSRISR